MSTGAADLALRMHELALWLEAELTLLADSLANLQRCGFREAYELEAYEYAADA